VPQKDLLHDTLSVGQALRYTAELRLPSDTGVEDLESSVNEILSIVGLSHRRATIIRNLSGGQLKRTSLANELMSKPTLLFLDEVTSGLDEQTDREMMGLFRIIAESGKTVVCITHNLANVEAECHLVVILTEGGRLGFVGTVNEAKTYFKIDRLGDVYRRLAERPAEAWQHSFQTCPLFARYINDRLPLAKPLAPKTATSKFDAGGPTNFLRQWQVLTRRYVSVLCGDVSALVAYVGQSLLVAILLAIVFGSLADIENPLVRGQRTLNLLFLLSVSSFWFGCNNAAKEFVKERAIFSRERDFNLRVDSYYASKSVVLASIGLLQVALLFAIVRVWCGPPGNAFGQLAILSLLAICGTTAGLLISVLARTEEVAVALVPVIVIPQIILAGVVAPLSGFAEVIARGTITSYSGQQGLEALIPAADSSSFGLVQRSLTNAMIASGIHAFLSILLAVLVLRRKRISS